MPSARIDSYFSLPTDLAAQVMAWPEFVRGENYHVEFSNAEDEVVVELIPAHEDDCDHVVVRAGKESRLFHFVLGFVSYALAAHSDNLQLTRWNQTP